MELYCKVFPILLLCKVKHYAWKHEYNITTESWNQWRTSSLWSCQSEYSVVSLFSFFSRSVLQWADCTSVIFIYLVSFSLHWPVVCTRSCANVVGSSQTCNVHLCLSFFLAAIVSASEIPSAVKPYFIWSVAIVWQEIQSNSMRGSFRFNIWRENSFQSVHIFKLINSLNSCSTSADNLWTIWEGCADIKFWPLLITRSLVMLIKTGFSISSSHTWN